MHIDKKNDWNLRNIINSERDQNFTLFNHGVRKVIISGWDLKLVDQNDLYSFSTAFIKYNSFQI